MEGMTVYLTGSADPQLPGQFEEVESAGLLDTSFACGAQLAPQLMQHLAPGESATSIHTWAPMTLTTSMLTWMQRMHVLHSPLPSHVALTQSLTKLKVDAMQIWMQRLRSWPGLTWKRMMRATPAITWMQPGQRLRQ